MNSYAAQVADSPCYSSLCSCHLIARMMAMVGTNRGRIYFEMVNFNPVSRKSFKKGKREDGERAAKQIPSNTAISPLDLEPSDTDQRSHFMQDIHALLSNLKRPKLLVRAARFGITEYDRTRDLRRIAGVGDSATSHSILSRLVELEEQAEETRLRRDGTYSVKKHVEVLVALMAEALHLKQLAQATTRKSCIQVVR